MDELVTAFPYRLHTVKWFHFWDCSCSNESGSRFVVLMFINAKNGAPVMVTSLHSSASIVWKHMDMHQVRLRMSAFLTITRSVRNDGRIRELFFNWYLIRACVLRLSILDTFSSKFLIMLECRSSTTIPCPGHDTTHRICRFSVFSFFHILPAITKK